MSATSRYWRKALLDLWFAGKTIKAILVTPAYVFSAAHQFRSDLGANTIGSAVAVSGLTTGVPNPATVDIADLTFAAVPNGQAAGIWYYQDTGDPATDLLIYFEDQITGFPVITNGADVTVTIDPGVNRLFTLGGAA